MRCRVVVVSRRSASGKGTWWAGRVFPVVAGHWVSSTVEPLTKRPLRNRRRPTLSPAAEQPAQIQHQLGCLHHRARSGCLTMKLSVDLCLAPFILSC